ncbi:MAG: ankyrin [Nitrospinae bacterium]|nr:ankyrin [Nitrospinota bacterium]
MRGINNLKGLHALRTMDSTKRRSIPRIQTSIYLDMYMLNTEKTRLLREDERLGARRYAIRKRLEEIEQEMNKLQEAETDESTVKARTNRILSKHPYIQKDGGKKEWKKIPLNY